MSMYLVDNKKEKCSGCQACKNVCPRKCIDMVEDNEGFLYPNIDKKKCINCKLCIKVCPYKGDFIEDNTELQEVYAVKNNDINIRSKSSSGGVFISLSDIILNQKGIICGAQFDDEFKVIHTLAKDEVGRDKYCCSKYVQSDIGNSYIEVKRILLEEKKVLFTGTPCQVDGLKHYLGKKYENLVTIDFVCHGVPSPLVFKLYLEHLKKKYKSKITNFNFRYKKEGWGTQNIKINFNNNSSYIKRGTEDKYYSLFWSNMILRPSCHKCKYSNTNRISDITIGDFWGISQISNGFNSEKGVSLLIINTFKGQELVKMADMNFYKEKHIIEHAKKFQNNLNGPCIENKKRNIYFYVLEKYGFKVAYFFCCTIFNYIMYIKRFLRNGCKLINKRNI